MIRVLLADDHHLVRQGIRVLLEKEQDIQVVGEVDDGLAAVKFVSQHKPDVVVMDINMPYLSGIQATEEIHSSNPLTRVVILSMYSQETMVRQAVGAGAVAYLLKHSLAEELVLAIRSAQHGDSYVSPGVSEELQDFYLGANDNVESTNPLDKLTPRERQVMQLIAEGHTTKSIAKNLSISGKTVEKHRSSLMAKLGQHDIAGVVRMAVKYGLIFLDD
jgi:DNA-binding NarL/FixJ family response regulator